MTTNEALVRDGIAAINSRDLRAWLATFDPSCRLYPLVGVDIEAVYDGHEGLARFWDAWFEPWDQLRLELVSVDDDGDLVVLDVRWIGEVAGAPPVEMPLGLAFTVSDGLWTLVAAAPTAADARDKLLAIAQDTSAS